jgi:hypothetical protein
VFVQILDNSFVKEKERRRSMRVNGLVVTAQYQGDEKKGTLLFELALYGVISVKILDDADILVELEHIPDEDDDLVERESGSFGQCLGISVTPQQVCQALYTASEGTGEVRVGLRGEIVVETSDTPGDSVVRTLEAPAQYVFCLVADQMIIFRDLAEICSDEALDIEVSADDHQ